MRVVVVFLEGAAVLGGSVVPVGGVLAALLIVSRPGPGLTCPYLSQIAAALQMQRVAALRVPPFQLQVGFAFALAVVTVVVAQDHLLLRGIFVSVPQFSFSRGQCCELIVLDRSLNQVDRLRVYPNCYWLPTCPYS